MGGVSAGAGEVTAPQRLRVALLGSYPTWPFRRQLELRRDTRHVTTTWNVNLANALARRPGIEVDFLTLTAGIPRTQVIQVAEHFRVHFLKMPRWEKALDLLLGLRLSTAVVRRKLRNIGPDIVHGIGTEHPFAHIATALDYPSVITVHGVVSRVVEALSLPPWSPKRAFARVERRVLRRARHIIVINPYVRQALPVAGTARTYNIENPIDPVFFKDEAGPRLRSGLLFVGMIQPRKGVDVLLNALTLIAPEERPALTIIGSVIPQSRRYRRLLQRFAATHGLDPCIIWQDSIDQAELSRRLRQVKALVLPSREETAPMVIAEALASGTPVVASDVGGVRYMIEPAVTGLLVPPEQPELLAHALRDVLTNDWYSSEARARNEARRRFHPDSVAEATESVYRKVIGHEFES